MTLRVRLLLTSLAIAVSLAGGYFIVDARQRLENKAEELRLSLELDAMNGLRERCEAAPPRTRPGRGGSPAFDPSRLDGRRARDQGAGPDGAFEYFAYDSGGRPASAAAPPLPAERDGRPVGGFWSSIVNGPSMVMRLAPDGPCAFVLARIPPRPRERRDQLEALALVVVSVLAATWIAGGPLIARLRRLETSARRSAAVDYAEPIAVDGRDEVASVAAAFNEAGRQVRAHVLETEAREATLRAYVANTTHDIAIPLTVLQGHLAALDRRLEEGAADRAVVHAAMQEAHYMSSLLRNLATVTALDAPDAAVVRAPVDVSALVARVAARHRSIARAQHVSLEFATPEAPLVIQSDPTLLEQALSNLVDNAVRYNRPGGHVAVLLDREGAGFRLSVTDDGPGVSPEEIASLTTRWFRGSEARTRRPDGKGLGLAIAAESIKRLGMTLSLGAPGEGTSGLRAEIVATA